MDSFYIYIIKIKIFSKTIVGNILIILWFLLFVYWTFGVGERLYNKLQDKSVLNLKRFKTLIDFGFIYSIIVAFFFNGGYYISSDNISQYGWKAWIISPLHLILMCSMIYTIYFLSKCIAILRNKQEEYGWYMLGFWFFPIGIWIIQPRIIELLNKESLQE